MIRINIKRNRTKVLAVATAMMLANNITAQTDILLTQQWFSRINMNPAATGNSNNIDVFVLARQQWSGFEDAPETGVVNIHSYFDRIRSGIGLTATYDKIGVGNNTINAQLAYAFHFDIGSNWLMSLGLSGGAEQRVFDPSKHFFTDPNPDPDFPSEKISKWSPDIDFGFELSSERFLIGASVTHLLKLPDESSTAYNSQQYYAYARYKQPVGDAAALTGGVRGSNFDGKYFLEASLTATFLNKFWVGGAFRPDNAVAAFAGLQVGFFRLGYAYDHSTGNTASLAKSSHEIMLSIKIGKSQKTVYTKSPRFIEN